MNRGWSRVPHIYCLTAVCGTSTGHGADTGALDLRLNQFGERAAVIFNVPEFLSRVERACNTASLARDYGLVEYVESQHHGEINCFTKPANYAWQKECRIAIAGIDDDVYRLEVGSLTDIATIGPALEVIESAKFEIAH